MTHKESAECLTAAQPPGTTPATRTGESPLSVRPSPPSLLCRQITRVGPQRARAQNTDRGPCNTEKSHLQLKKQSELQFVSGYLLMNTSYQSLEDISNLDCGEVGWSDVGFLVGLS